MRFHFHLRRAALVLVVASAPLASCVDPVEDELVASLGDEVTGVRPGPFHRPGQPCLACHDDAGPGPTFSLGGTVFATPTDATGVSAATVTVVDALGQVKEFVSNCVGNFYLPGDAGLAYPLRAEVSCTMPDGTVRRNVMGTRIARDGSCAGCHRGDPSSDSPGRVSCAPEQPDPPFVAEACSGGGR